MSSVALAVDHAPAAPAEPDHAEVPLTAAERRALIAALYVVKDNWWLHPIEQRLLDRLEAPFFDR